MDASAERAQQPSRRTWILLLFVSALAFGLRFGAIGRLLPVQPEPDAGLVWTYRTMCGEEIKHQELFYGIYPNLLPGLLTVLPGGGTLALAPVEAGLREHLAAATEPYLRVRLLIAALSFLAAPLVFFLARRWMSDSWALLAAAFLATALMHVAHSSVAKAHAAEVTLAWLALLCVLRQIEAPSIARAAACAAAAALAIGTIQTGFFLLPPLLLGAWYSRRASRATFVAACLAPFAAVAVGLLFIPGGLGIGSAGVKMGRGHTIPFEGLDGSGLAAWPRFLWDHDPLLAILAALGLLLALFSIRSAPRARWLVVAAYALPYVTVISLDKNVADRYLLPLYPLAAILAALAASWLQRRTRGRLDEGAVCGALLALPLWVSCSFTWIGRRPTTLQQLGNWLEQQPGSTSKKLLLAPSVSPPLFPTALALQHQLDTTTGRSQPWFYYLGRLAHVPQSAPGYPLETIALEYYARAHSAEEVERYLDEQRPDWVVIEVSRRMFTFAGLPSLREVLRRRGTLLATLSGEGGNHIGDVPIDYQGADELARRVLSADCFGPPLEVYRWNAR